MIFFNTDRQMDTQTPYKTNHPTTLNRYGQKKSTPFFLPLSKWSELALLAHSILFGLNVLRHSNTAIFSHQLWKLNTQSISRPSWAQFLKTVCHNRLSTLKNISLIESKILIGLLFL